MALCPFHWSVCLDSERSTECVCVCECVKRKGIKKRQSAIHFWTSNPSFVSAWLKLHGCHSHKAICTSNFYLQYYKLWSNYYKKQSVLSQKCHIWKLMQAFDKKTQTAGNDLWISSLSKLITRCYIIGLLSYPTCLHSSPLTCIGTQNHLRHTCRCLFLARGQENWLHRSVMVIQQRSRPSLAAGHTWKSKCIEMLQNYLDIQASSILIVLKQYCLFQRLQGHAKERGKTMYTLCL